MRRLLFPIHWLCYNQTFNNLISQAGQMVTYGIPNELQSLEALLDAERSMANSLVFELSDRDLSKLDDRARRAVLGRELAMVIANPRGRMGSCPTRRWTTRVFIAAGVEPYFA